MVYNMEYIGGGGGIAFLITSPSPSILTVRNKKENKRKRTGTVLLKTLWPSKLICLFTNKNDFSNFCELQF